MARTRAKAGLPASTTSPSRATSSASASRYALPPESDNPPKLFILPRKATERARIVSLLNPRYSKPTRYLVCPETGIYEFTRVAAPRSTTPRSWLIQCRPGEMRDQGARGGEDFGAYVTKGADLFVATPIDPAFLVLPAVAAKASLKSERRLFQSSEDYFDAISESSPHLSEILRWEGVRKLLESRMAAICDTVVDDGETMFRFSPDKLLHEMLAKSRRMSQRPLPKSMEDKFVTKALEAPVLGINRKAAASGSIADGAEPVKAGSEASTPEVEPPESQATVTSAASGPGATVAATSASDEPTVAPEVVASMQASEDIVQLQRLRTSFSFLRSSYIAPVQAEELRRLLAGNSSVDFAPLDDYLARLKKIREEALAARSMADYSRKHALDDEEIAERAERKSQKDEEGIRRKAGESRGVRDLKKVNTQGMKKMSDFFKKKS